MPQCPVCSTPAPPAARFCPSCGGVVDASRLTEVAPPPSSAASSATPVLRSGALSPGEVVAGRYRIAGLLGRGGMGEVYRADDLKLGQPVALKFLPRALERDPSARERFHAEVRLARQVSHPHVCRVHDIGEVDGRPFLSMEYVDGEDLATLLRRIGRLPGAKAVEIARQLCAGLAAAHDKGVLHRDLKPSNVMVDGHGRARITDFGLAVGWQESRGEMAGTPAYMAPERLAGGPATVRSDLYELGLVLYELFTGKHAFEEQRPASRPLTHPSAHTGDIDPTAERAILRCLEAEPERRPGSAAELALALPGADPLAAAIAAGETPSPEMVAAAGGEGGLSRARAWTLLLGCAALVAAVAALSPASTDIGIAPMDQGPQVLRHRTEEVAARFGYGGPVADSLSWMERNYPLIRWLADNLPSTEWRRRLAQLGSPVVVHLRRSPEPLDPDNVFGQVSVDDPAPIVPGMLHVIVDATGRLCLLQAVPDPWQREPAPPDPAPWDALFVESRLDPTRFTEVTPTWLPPVPFDTRREWTGTIEALPELPVRVSAATLRDRIVYLRLLAPWDAPAAVDPLAGLGPQQTTLSIVFAVLLFAVPLIARRNVRLGRGDRRGAGRLAVVAAAFSLFAWLATAHLALDGPSVRRLGGAVAAMMLQGLAAWLGYLALEPYLRRRMPELLIGWTRVLEGRRSDPRVGRDVLWGALLGAAAAAAFHLVNGLPTWLPFPSQTTIPQLGGLGGAPMSTGAFFALPFLAFVRALTMMLVAFLLRLVLRRPAAAFVGAWVVFTLLFWGGENLALEAPMSVLIALLFAVAVTRFGLLATTAAIAVQSFLTTYPPVLSGSGWYTPYALGSLGLVAVLLIWSFRVSLAGKPAFGGSLDA